MTRTLVALAAVCLVLLPLPASAAPASPFASAAPSVTGEASIVAGGIDLHLTNNGTTPILYDRGITPDGQQLTSAVQAGAQCTVSGSQFHCGPFSVSPGGTFTIQLRSPQVFTSSFRLAPASAAAKFFTFYFSPDGQQDIVYNIPIVPAPSSPPPSVTPPPPPPPVQCKCITLAGQIVPSSIKFTNPGETGGMHLEFTVSWTMTCTKGKGGCHGTLDLVPPAGKGYTSYFKKSKGSISCNGPCAASSRGMQHFVLIGNRGLGGDKRGKAVPYITITVKPKCGVKALRPELLALVFDKRTALVDKKHSKLK